MSDTDGFSAASPSPAPGRPPLGRKRLRGALRTLVHPATYFQAVRILHFYSYSHAIPRRRLTMGPGSTIAPNISIRNPERIRIGADTKIGEHAYLWAGDSEGRITIGDHCRLGPEVFITASDYGLVPGEAIAHQERRERDVVIGDDVWLGVRVFVGAGAEIGDGCVVSAGSVVTRSLPPGSIAAGVPARVVRRRDEYAESGGTRDGVESENSERPDPRSS